MKARILLPFLIAPAIGVAIGLQLADEPEQDAAATYSAATAAVAAAGETRSGGGPGGQEDGAPGFSFADVMSIMRSGGDAPGASALQQAFDEALAMAPGEARTQALQRAYTRWLLEAPASAAAHIERIPAEERRAIVSAALAVLAERRPSNFRQYAATLGQERSDLAAVIGAIAERHPGEALEWIREHAGPDSVAELTAAALPGLIRNDIAAAARAVADLQEGAPVALIQQVAAAYAGHDPAQAYQWVSQIIGSRSDTTPGQLLDEVSSSLAAGDQNAAAQFMSRTQDPAVRQSLMSELAIRKGQDDLAAAWNWLNQYSSDPVYPDAAQKLLYRWSYTKPQEVAQILASVGNPTLQANAAAHLTRFWQQKDQASYQTWVASLPPGPLRNSAIAAR